MARIVRIEPKVPEVLRKKRVAAYARVSMAAEGPHHSLSAQISRYSSLIQSVPDWSYAGVYADYGISGTGMKKRDEFNRLIADCDEGRIDMILVKSVSRFARDTVDTLNTTRHLKDIGVDVYFERENVHSMSNDGELLLTLLAAFAQAESNSLSENAKWAMRKKFKEGIPRYYHAPYGYKWNGEMFTIVPEEGTVIRRIYDSYLSGSSAYRIAKDLREDGVTGAKGLPLDESTVKEILTSSSYAGTMVLQKNFITEGHKRRRNHGELPMYAVSDMYEPLVTEDELQKTKDIRKMRAAAMPNRKPEITAFSGRIRCGCCGSSVSRRTCRYGKKWKCNTCERKGRAACDLRDIYESELKEMAAEALMLTEYDDATVRERITQITLDNAYVVFSIDNGKAVRLPRKYRMGYSGFSGKVFCGRCGGVLEADVWKIGPKDHKEKVKVWVCRNCDAPRLPDADIRKAAREILKSDDYEGLFAQNILKAVNHDDRIEFIYKKEKVSIWQKE